jgi:hypothetical protein
MKKFFLPAAVVVALAFASCSKDALNSGNNGNPSDTTGNGNGNGNGNPVIGKDSVVTFSDVKFGLAPGDYTYGRVFSSVTGLVYPDDAIPDSVGKYMHLAFAYQGVYAMFFTSADPNSFDITIPGVTKTNVRNYVDSSFKVNSFDTLTHASALAKLTVADDNETFEAADLPVIVFFKRSDGKIGIMKVKALSDTYLTVDVKVAY